MKKLILVLIMMILAFSESFSKRYLFTYDNAGNRISRTFSIKKIPVLNDTVHSMLSEKYKIKVFPNPTNGNITFQFNANDIYANAVIIITDISGKIISNTNYQDINVGENNVVINNLNLANGTYYFQIVLNTQVLNGKFLIQK